MNRKIFQIYISIDYYFSKIINSILLKNNFNIKTSFGILFRNSNIYSANDIKKQAYIIQNEKIKSISAKDIKIQEVFTTISVNRKNNSINLTINKNNYTIC